MDRLADWITGLTAICVQETELRLLKVTYMYIVGLTNNKFLQQRNSIKLEKKYYLNANLNSWNKHSNSFITFLGINNSKKLKSINFLT